MCGLVSFVFLLPVRRLPLFNQKRLINPPPTSTMADEEDIAALVIDNGSGMCKGKYRRGGQEGSRGRGRGAPRRAGGGRRIWPAWGALFPVVFQCTTLFSWAVFGPWERIPAPPRPAPVPTSPRSRAAVPNGGGRRCGDGDRGQNGPAALDVSRLLAGLVDREAAFPPAGRREHKHIQDRILFILPSSKLPPVPT